ncbi:MAG: response regulator transcription factor, partial [Firmicutes bacterium]|nr:response regulator transcription factor [Bacillota bacterium]
ACKKKAPQLVILDVMLPGDDGFEILKRIRQGEAGGDPAVIMVTAKTSEIDKVMGLNGGADDYIAKPFGIMEFVARVKAVLRRTGSPETEVGDELICGQIRLDENRHQVTSAGQTVELTYKEFELLKYLMRHEGQVMSRQQIMDTVWDTDFCGESRTVDMHVKTLRQKLGACGSYIRTVRNIGYKLEQQE